MESDFEPSNDTLQLTVLLIRHGDRAPYWFHPDDPNKHLWPGGAESLTPLGKHQAFQLGQQLRQRYEGFLSPELHSDEVYARSTDTDRCLITGQACLAGLFPPQSKDDIWDVKNSWLPAVIHTVPVNIDECSLKYEGFIEPLLAHLSPECFQHFQTNKEIYDKVKRALGTTTNENLYKCLGVIESIYIEKMMGLPTPHDFGYSKEHLYKILMEMIELLSTKYPGVLYAAAASLDVILEVIKKKVEGKTPRLKSYFFFVHDLNISSILALVNGGFERPVYVSMMIFELHKHPKTKEFYVQVAFKNGLNREQRVIKLGGHHNVCTIEDFDKYIRCMIMLFKF